MEKNLLRQLIMLSKRLMYAFLIQLLMCTVLLASTGNAQRKTIEEVRVSVDLRDKTLLQFFRQVESKTDFKFTYNDDLVDLEQKVTVEEKNRSLYQVLEAVSRQVDLHFVQVNENIHVKSANSEKEKSVEIAPVADVTVSGVVTDPSGEPIPGVTVSLPGTSIGTATDLDGRYSLTVPEGSTLVFSFIGFETQSIAIGERSVIDLVLNEDMASLDEVVVVGYGVQNRRDLTGSVSSIKKSDLEAQPINSFDQALQGRVAGVQVTQASNAPGGGINIRIRGGNSISASNDPLYVIDGFPITNPSPASGSSNSAIYSSPMAFINPNDIVSIEVLKDASATAIYGSRGANGVVLVTTKRGNTGHPLVEVESYYGVQNITRTLDLINAEEHLLLKNEQLVNLGYEIRYGNPEGNYPKPPSEYGDGNDWQALVFRTASIQNHQLTVSGGSEKIKYLFSGGYFDQKGIIVGSDFKRYTSRLNLDAEISNRVRMGANFNVSRNISNSVNEVGGNSMVALALRYSPASPIYDEDGSWQLLNVGPGSGFGNFANPLAVANTTTNELVISRVLTNVFTEIEPVNGLIFRVSLGADFFNSERDIFYTPETLIGSDVNGYGSNGNTNNLNLLNENTVHYSKIINDHSFDLLAGITFQKNTEKRAFVEAQDFPNFTLGSNNLGMANQSLPPVGSVQEWGLNSYLSRINYKLKDKYIITATGRIDGSSRFGTNNKYAFFPSGAIAWRVSDENFLKNSTAISDAKLRASYGSTGNDGIGLYNSLSSYSTARTVFNDIQVLKNEASRIANPDLKWEKTNQLNVGLDFALVNNRFFFTTDFYVKNTSDLLLDVQLPATTGFTSVTRNIGSVQNKGYEFSLSSVNTTGSFKWTSDANISFNKNKVISLADADEYLVGSGYNAIIIKVGEPLGSFYGNIFDGIWQSVEEIENAGEVARPGDMPGAPRFKDLDGNGVFNEAEDRAILGNGLPDFYYGITNNFSYKGFDLSIFIQGVQGNEVYNFTRTTIGGPDANTPLLREVHENYWRPERPSNRYPAMKQWRYTNTSSNFVEDGSFIRLKNVVLGYTIPVGEGFLRNARVYISGQNLITLTQYSGFDPEVNSNFNSNVSYGVDAFAYPLARTFMIGGRIQF